MKILVAIDAPSFGNTGEFDRRAQQWEQNELGRMIHLLAERIVLGVPSGQIASQDGKATLRRKTETPIDKPATGEEAVA